MPECFAIQRVEAQRREGAKGFAKGWMPGSRGLIGQNPRGETTRKVFRLSDKRRAFFASLRFNALDSVKAPATLALSSLHPIALVTG
jgi:hypothetical protein